MRLSDVVTEDELVEAQRLVKERIAKLQKSADVSIVNDPFGLGAFVTVLVTPRKDKVSLGKDGWEKVSERSEMLIDPLGIIARIRTRAFLDTPTGGGALH